VKEVMSSDNSGVMDVDKDVRIKHLQRIPEEKTLRTHYIMADQLISENGK